MKIQESKGRYFITLPKQYVRLLGWQKKTELAIFPNGQKGELTVKELKA